MNREIRQQWKSIGRHIETLEQRRETYSVADVVFRYKVGVHHSLSLLHYMDLHIRPHRAPLSRIGSVAALRNTRSSVSCSFIGLQNSGPFG